MGDRANIVITAKSTAKAVTLKDALKGGAIVLYTHWGGYQLGHDLARALRAASGLVWSFEDFAAMSGEEARAAHLRGVAP